MSLPSLKLSSSFFILKHIYTNTHLCFKGTIIFFFAVLFLGALSVALLSRFDIFLSTFASFSSVFVLTALLFDSLGNFDYLAQRAPFAP